MKRDINIQPLSREHHHSLLFCWKIRQGVSKNIDTARINKYVHYFWATHLYPHFVKEEKFLFNLFKDELITNAINQHCEIKLCINTLSNLEKPHSVLYLELAGLLDAHIRFEERVLFPHLEKIVNPSKLTIIGVELEKEALKENFEDAFWE